MIILKVKVTRLKNQAIKHKYFIDTKTLTNKQLLGENEERQCKLTYLCRHNMLW